MNRIGKIYTSILPYFNKREKKIKYKSRPVMIIAEPVGFDTEYTILPVSTISNPAFYSPVYDTELIPENFPNLTLNKKSYIRSHKQTTVYKSSIDFDQCLGDIRDAYPVTFHEVMEKLRYYNQTVLESC